MIDVLDLRRIQTPYALDGTDNGVMIQLWL